MFTDRCIDTSHSECAVIVALKKEARWAPRYIGPIADAKEVFLDGIAFRNSREDPETYQNRLGEL